MSRVEGVQRSRAFKGLKSRRSQQISKILGRQDYSCEVHGFKGYNMSKHSKVSMAQKRQVLKVKRSRVNYEIMDINI